MCTKTLLSLCISLSQLQFLKQVLRVVKVQRGLEDLDHIWRSLYQFKTFGCFLIMLMEIIILLAFSRLSSRLHTGILKLPKIGIAIKNLPLINEPLYKETVFLLMQKQRCRSLATVKS